MSDLLTQHQPPPQSAPRHRRWFLRPWFIVTVAVALVSAIAVTATVLLSGGTANTKGPGTNGLENKSAAEVLQQAVSALEAAKSVHVVMTGPNGSLDRVDARMQGTSSTGTFTHAGIQLEFTVIGSDGYIKADQAGLKALGAPPAVQRYGAGRWLRSSPKSSMSLTLATLAPQLTTYYGPLEPKVRQATLDGKKVVVVSYQNGSKVFIANTGPAYPLRAQYKGQDVGLIVFTQYDAPLHITAPHNAIEPPAASASPSATATRPTNGLEKMSAAAVSHEAIGMFSLARSVRVQGTMTGGVPAQKFDLRYEGSSISGSYVEQGSTYEYIAAGGRSYLKTSAAGWEAMGNAPDVAGMLAGHWQQAGSAPSGEEWPSRSIFVTELGLREAAQGATVAQATLGGRLVVVVTYPDGSKLYVANTGPAYPVRFDVTGNGGGRRDFSQYGTQFHITAPKSAQ